jgi:small subunit ribosomal protein S4e
MAKKHMKTLTVPVSWPVKRKSTKFTIKPNPGKSFDLGVPLAIVFKNMLKHCKTSKEVRTILMDKEVLVDLIRVKDQKILVGLMDSLAIPVSNEYYRVLIKTNKRMYLKEITKEEASIKVCKIIGKKILKKGKVQLNLFDGRNIIVTEDKYKVGDSVVIEVPKQTIKKGLKLEKGAYAYMIKGGHIGEHGLVEEINNNSVKIKKDKEEFETSLDSVFIVGKTKPEIKLD